MATILVVDDRPGNRDLLRTILGYQGHTIIEAGDGAEGLEKIREQTPDLIVTDLLMPGMDGSEFVRELRSMPPTQHTPVIFYTANYLEEEIAHIAKAYSVASVLIHGDNPQLLINAVSTALSEQAQAPEPADSDASDGSLIRRHLAIVNGKLIQKIRDMEAKEAALYRSEERFRQMAESAPVGIVLGDPRGYAWYINARMADLLGRPSDDMLAFGWQEHLGLQDWHPNLTDQSPARHRCEITRADGTVLWLDISLNTARDAAGTPWGTIAVVDDVTASVRADTHQRELDARLRVSERLESLGHLAGGVAHDFNNILTAILAYTDFAQATVVGWTADGLIGEPASQNLINDLNMVRQAGNRGAGLTAQLLAFGRPDLAQPEKIDINVVVLEVKDLLARTIGDHVELTTELAAVAPVKADAIHLGQIILNLALNARDAMPDGGQITISTTDVVHDASTSPVADGQLPAGRYVKLTVRDDGAGMPSEVLERALDPFYTTKPPGEGTGLGLATVNSVARQAGGRLSITSTVAIGTTVDVWLPIATTELDTPVLAADSQTPGGTETILVIDDQQDICNIAKRTLTRAGYRVHTVNSGTQALELIEALPAPIDLLITDVVMPPLPGGQLTSQVTATHPHTRVLYMSGYTDVLPDAEAGPDTAILPKPFQTADLLLAVRAALDHKVDAVEPGRQAQP
jgi:two-component system cell cycle sensor histidine kinase/response regulator CckA